MDDQLQAIATKLVIGRGSRRGGGVRFRVWRAHSDVVDRARIIETLQFLRDDPVAQCVSIIDISGVDFPQREKRFDVVYHLLSPKLNWADPGQDRD